MYCSVCLSSAVFPVRLRCKHIFCYLCVKGLINVTQKCPLCREDIPNDLLTRPNFVKKSIHSDRPDFSGPQWFYEGRPGFGFWAYDFSNGRLLEAAHHSGQNTCEIIISGVEYCVDFVTQMQYRKDCPMKRRKIRRDLLNHINRFKGIAGVPKHLLIDMNGGASNANQSNSSGQQISAQLNSTPANDSTENNGQHIPKKIKIEVKKEPKDDPDCSPQY